MLEICRRLAKVSTKFKPPHFFTKRPTCLVNECSTTLLVPKKLSTLKLSEYSPAASSLMMVLLRSKLREPLKIKLRCNEATKGHAWSLKEDKAVSLEIRRHLMG